MGKIIKSQMDELFDDLSIPARPSKADKKKDSITSTPSVNPKEKNVPVSKGKHKKLNKMTFCARISQSNMDKVKILSENKSIPISDIIDFALEDFLNKYEKKNGEITSQAPRGVADLLK